MYCTYTCVCMHVLCTLRVYIYTCIPTQHTNAYSRHIQIRTHYRYAWKRLDTRETRVHTTRDFNAACVSHAFMRIRAQRVSRVPRLPKEHVLFLFWFLDRWCYADLQIWICGKDTRISCSKRRKNISHRRIHETFIFVTRTSNFIFDNLSNIHRALLMRGSCNRRTRPPINDALSTGALIVPLKIRCRSNRVYNNATKKKNTTVIVKKWVRCTYRVLYRVHASEKKRKIMLRYFDIANYVLISPDVSG